MSIKFFGILTHQGAARLANAAALGTKLDLSTMAVGDGGGSLPFPEPTQTALKGERRRAALNQLSIDPLNGNQIIAEQVIPENEGGWWIREIGLFDKDGALIAVANCPESYKPQMQEGSGRTQTIRMILIVNSTEELALKIDPSIVLATRHYVDDGVIEVKAYADALMATHIHHADPHPQYAPKASPVFTGTPRAPTAKVNDNSTQLATTAFVQTAQNACLRKDDNLAALKDKARSRENLEVYSRSEADNHYLPKTGGTVNGDITLQGTQISLRGDNRKHLGFHNQDGSVRMWLYKDKGGDGVRLHNGDDGGGEYVFHKDGGFRVPSSVYAGAARMAADGNIHGSVWGGYLSEWLHNHILQGIPAGIPLPFPGEVPPSGWLKCNGQAFNKKTYPVLASLYPTGKLPDLRGEFIRGWDDGRKVDRGRTLLSTQDDAMQPITARWVLDDMSAGGDINYPPSGALYIDTTANVNYDAMTSRHGIGARAVFDSARQTRTADETRPRNIAFNYIVRAA